MAEDLAQGALLAALEQWPESGVPENPGAWLMAAARRRAIDQLRRARLIERRDAEREHALESLEGRAEDADLRLDDPIGDDLLRLLFTACHPALPSDGRIAL